MRKRVRQIIERNLARSVAPVNRHAVKRWVRRRGPIAEGKVKLKMKGFTTYELRRACEIAAQIADNESSNPCFKAALHEAVDHFRKHEKEEQEAQC